MNDDTALHIIRQRPTATAKTVVQACLEEQIPAVTSLYMHIPFCAHKCHYCDFYSFVDSRDRQSAFVDRFQRELEGLAPLSRGEPLRSIFVGGGTPTLLQPELWTRLLATLDSCFDLSAIQRGAGEFTIECNPETASEELFGLLRAGGVNRISVGAQTFHPAHLETLERRHDPANVARALELARDAGVARRSVDLIYAIPGQTLAEMEDDLRQAFSLPIDHLSAYNLTYEPNTAMTQRLQKGEFVPADEDLELEMFWAIRNACLERGLEAYEISNFARGGSECLHNLAYWRQADWLAAGPSASGHIGGHRYKVVPRLTDYLETDDSGFAPIIDHEPPDPSRALSEQLMTGLRLREGLPFDTLVQSAEPLGVQDALLAELARTEAEGWIERQGNRLTLTRDGLPLADHVAACLMASVS